MLKTFVTIILLTFFYNVWGQDSLNYHGQPVLIRDLSSKKAKPPLCIIKVDSKICEVSNSRQIQKIFKKFNVDWIQSIDVLKEKSDTEKYGTLGQYGVIIINLKHGTYNNLSRKLRRVCR